MSRTQLHRKQMGRGGNGKLHAQRFFEAPTAAATATHSSSLPGELIQLGKYYSILYP